MAEPRPYLAVKYWDLDLCATEERKHGKDLVKDHIKWVVGGEKKGKAGDVGLKIKDQIAQKDSRRLGVSRALSHTLHQHHLMIAYYRYFQNP